MKQLAKKVVMNTPILRTMFTRYARRRRAAAMQATPPQEIFTEIYRRNAWQGTDSVSGTGSDATQTAAVVAALPRLFTEHGITSMVDVPCGDFHWMKRVDLSSVAYIGGDVVADLIAANQHHAVPGRISFEWMDLIKGPLPRVDLVFCRDCLVHFSPDDIFRSLSTVVASGSRLLLTTTFIARSENAAIATGDWRPLNLQAAPFLLPTPIALIDERCTEGSGAFADKSLALWRVSDIAARLGAVK